MDNSLPAQTDKRRLYGRRLGRPLSEVRQHALETLLPRCQFPIPEKGRIDPRTAFPAQIEKIICEIGFGDGDHLAEMMKRAPRHGYIGAEPFINGMSALLKQILEEGIDPDHLRVWMDDAIALLETFTDQSLDEIYILNPDPWPKARHHKRRIVNQDNLDLFARLLKPGSLLIMTTDLDDLAEWMVTEASNHPEFVWTAASQQDWKTPPANWIETKYERKGRMAGRTQTYLLFRRR
ncbi:MAG: tRNA (guanosine(46)-N7)-methyltransferase TrmB [Rhodospirillales bacterium]|nr:tRNA (guanosine(46)-N7)-methyltransferase TrmB [Rhodospirillales bacterium]MCB9973390.1 tRNA (guanosine(46)-N7)-methyltransferase TrmB [Rhodospirillales bacterium]